MQSINKSWIQIRVSSPEQLGLILGQLVTEALRSPEQFERRRQAGLAFVRQHYQPGQLVQGWSKLYRALAGTQGAASDWGQSLLHSVTHCSADEDGLVSGEGVR